MSFSFNTTAGASQSTAKPRLAGNSIYDVKFDGCEIQDIQGVKDPDKVYKVIKLKFSNESGTFEHTVFEPRPEDFKRGETEYKNKEGKMEKIPQPSGIESMMLLFKHAIDAIVPSIGKEIDEQKRSLGANDWEGLRKLVVTILDKGKGNSTKIKLLKNSKTGEAVFPGFFAGLTRPDTDGVSRAYVKNNFIGEKLAFSTYEADRIKKESEAKPTKVDSFVPETSSTADVNTDGLDMTFDVL